MSTQPNLRQLLFQRQVRQSLEFHCCMAPSQHEPTMTKTELITFVPRQAPRTQASDVYECIFYACLHRFPTWSSETFGTDQLCFCNLNDSLALSEKTTKADSKEVTCAPRQKVADGDIAQHPDETSQCSLLSFQGTMVSLYMFAVSFGNALVEYRHDASYAT